MASWASRSRTSRRSGLLILGGVIVAALAACPLADAQQSETGGSEATDPCLTDALCRAHFVRARKLSKKEDFEGALAAYQAAHHRREVPWLLINIGRTLQKLGRPKDAIPYFQQYLSTAPAESSALKDKARQYLKDAEEEVSLIASGARPAALVRPSSEPLEEEPPPEMPEPPPGPSEPVVPALVKSQPVPVQAPAPVSRWRSPGTVAGLTVGGALLLTGALTGGFALATAGQLRQTAYVGDAGSEQADLQARAQALALATDVLIPVGAVVLGSTLLITALRRPRRETRSALRPTAYSGTRSFALALSGAF